MQSIFMVGAMLCPE